jgi:hypothetical protein
MPFSGPSTPRTPHRGSLTISRATALTDGEFGMFHGRCDEAAACVAIGAGLDWQFHTLHNDYSHPVYAFALTADRVRGYGSFAIRSD